VCYTVYIYVCLSFKGTRLSKQAEAAVADLGFVAWGKGGGSKNSRGRREFQDDVKLTNLVN